MVKYSQIMAQRKWKRFPGNNRFYCNGLLMSANQIGILIFVAIVILVTGALFFAFDSRFLIETIHPIGLGAIFPVLGALGMFYSLAFLFKTGCIDPGIVPRSRPDEVAYQTALGEEDQTSTAKGYVGVPARYKTVVVRGQQVKLKWCATCNIWRPPRASHCGLCNNCYENFDHHCPVVGNCVAKRNYRFFYLFLVTVSVMCLYVMGCNVAVVVVASRMLGFGEALKNYPASVIEFGICGLSLISVSGLAAMHTWLIARMETTNEDIKGTFNPRRQGRSVQNPYTQRNCCVNFCIIVCGPFTPSLINRRGFVDETRVTVEDEAEVGYGATSSAPKLPPEPQVSTSLDQMPPVTEQPRTSNSQTTPLNIPTTPDTTSPTVEIRTSRDSSQPDDETQKLLIQ